MGLGSALRKKIQNIMPQRIWEYGTYFYLKIFRKEESNLFRVRMDLFSDSYKYKSKFEKEISYMKDKQKLYMFPYSFIEKYNSETIEVFYDNAVQMPYVMHKGKKLYYPSDMSADEVRKSYCAILLEQDEESPHKYFSQNYDFKDNDIFLDVGCAEGNMALEVVDRAKNVFLFEASERWMPALKETFKPYQDRVYIVNKFVGDAISEKETTIDYEVKSYLGDLYIKIDAEGSEFRIIRGAQNTLKNRRVVCACCTYHKQEDAETIKKLFVDKGYKYEFSKGAVLFKAQKNLKAPYFRHGLIRVSNYDI